MMKSKIPLPSKRSAQSAIPLPTKGLGTKSKTLSLNSKETVVAKKAVSVRQVPPISSKVRKNEDNVVKRLPSKSRDSKKPSVLSKKPSCKSYDGKKVAVTNKEHITENKLIKQPKIVPGRQLQKIIVSKPESRTETENHSKRFSSKSHNSKNAVLSNNKSNATNKSAVQSKFAESKKSNKISTNSLQESTNRSLSVNEKEEKAVTPMKQINLAIKFGVEDSEFKDSCFFKSLILNKRELSPGIIKQCSKAKISASEAYLRQPLQKNSFHFQTADDFVEEVKRTSSKYYRLNGRLVLQSPVQLKHKEKSAEDFVEEVKRNSARFQQRKRNLFHSPGLAPKNSFQRLAQDVVSVKENLDMKLVDEVRRLSEFRRQTSLNADSFLTNRRWTCNVSSKPSIANMNTSEIAAELRRITEMRRDSGAQLYKKAPVLEQHYSGKKLNPHQKVLQEIACLTAKKKDRMKKKVTFSIPFPDSSYMTTSTSAKPEAKLSDISECSSRNCTPELDLGCGKDKTNSKSGEEANNVEVTLISTTPELNMTPYLSHKNDTSTNNNSSDNQTVSSEVVKKVSETNPEQCSQNSDLTNFISSKFSSLKIIDNNVCISQGISDSNLTSFKNCLIDKNSNSYSEFLNFESTNSLFKSVHKSTVPTNCQPVNETEKFCVNTEKKLYTPHPVNLHSKSNFPSDVSPSFLSRKFSTMNSLAPICTPFVLKTLSHSPEVSLNQVRQKLDFTEKSNCFMDRRESQIMLQTIPTIQKMNDFLCDQECIILSSQSSGEEVFFRSLQNPVASILNNGDEMHFIPINSP